MGQLGRMIALVAVTINNFVLAIMYVRVGLPMIEIGRNIGSGPYSSVFGAIELALPVIIGGLQLGVILWVIAGPVQDERARRVR